MGYQTDEKGCLRSHDPLVRAIEECTAAELLLLWVMLAQLERAQCDTDISAPARAPSGEAAP